jgi:hypothetical protein
VLWCAVVYVYVSLCACVHTCGSGCVGVPVCAYVLVCVYRVLSLTSDWGRCASLIVSLSASSPTAPSTTSFASPLSPSYRMPLSVLYCSSHCICVVCSLVYVVCVYVAFVFFCNLFIFVPLQMYI